MGAMNSSQNRYRMSCKPDGSIYASLSEEEMEAQIEIEADNLIPYSPGQPHECLKFVQLQPC